MKMDNMKNIRVQKVYFWNTFGSLLNAGFSVVAVMIINRTTTTYDAGLFTLGFANAMLLQHVGSFDSRSHQCADAKKRFCFSDYFTFRLFTCLLMVMVAATFVFFNRYTFDRALVTYLLVSFCVFTNISDIFQGLAQKNERLDISGQSMSLRTIFGIVLFTVILAITRSLYFAIVGLIVAQIMIILLFDIPKTYRFSRPQINLNFGHLKILLIETFPLFLSLFLQAYIYNIPKYAIDLYLSMEAQAIYGILFMPASIVTLCGSFIFRPILTKLSLLWEEKKYKQVTSMCMHRIFALIGITLFVTFLGYMVGTPVLSILYAMDVSKYKLALAIVLLGGGFTGVTTLLYFMATAVHKQYKMFLCYFLSFIVSILVAFPMVKNLGIIGAAWSYLISSLFLNVMIIGLMIRTVHQAVYLEKQVRS